VDSTPKSNTIYHHMHPRTFSIIVIGRINSNTIVEGHSEHAEIICRVVLIKKRGVMLKTVGLSLCRFHLDFFFPSPPRLGSGWPRGRGDPTGLRIVWSHIWDSASRDIGPSVCVDSSRWSTDSDTACLDCVAVTFTWTQVQCSFTSRPRHGCVSSRCLSSNRKTGISYILTNNKLTKDNIKATVYNCIQHSVQHED